MKRSKFLKCVSTIVAAALLVSGVPFMNGTNIVEANNYGLSNPRVTFITRETVQFGHYLQEDTNGDGVVNESDEKQPITWQVLEKDSAGNALLLADKVLDVHVFNEIYNNVAWETSDIRYWLNDIDENDNYNSGGTGFYNTAFTERERNLIQKSHVVDDNSKSTAYLEGDSYNKIFLLSADEITNSTYHFEAGVNVYDEARLGEPTTYAKNKGPICDVSGEYCWYWLRSISASDFSISMVEYNGLVSGISSPKCSDIGVRPALRINLNSAKLTTSTKQIAHDNTIWDSVTFGSYNGEPLKWRVLSVNGNDALLLADDMVAVKSYNDEDKDITWKDCTLRSWLNGNDSGCFYADAFNVDERAAIKTTTVVNNDNLFYGTDGGENTQDKIYIPSLDEITNISYGFTSKYMCWSNSRIARYFDGENYYYRCYWLRTPGDEQDTVLYVDFDGDYVPCGGSHSSGHNVVLSDEEIEKFGPRFGGVLPVLHLDLSKTSVWKKGKTINAEDLIYGRHKHRMTRIPGQPPSCVYSGYKDYYCCEVCGLSYTDELGENEMSDPWTPWANPSLEIPATGHKWNKGEITEKSTPTSSGIRTYTCTTCGETKDETIKPCAKYKNNLKVSLKKGGTKSIQYSKLKKSKQAFEVTDVISVSNANGKVSYKLVSVNKSKYKKYFSVEKNGRITVKKGLKKGTYTLNINVNAAGNSSYKSASKTVKVEIKVKSGAKYENNLKVSLKKGGTKSIQYSKLKKSKQAFKVTDVISVSNANGKVAYKLVSVNKSKYKKCFSVEKNGRITVKKGLKKGTYTLNINVNAAGNSSYESASKTVKVKINVK